MSNISALDGNTLSWVKTEIDSTMDNARKALESYVETPDDESQLRFCINYLHQVYGTLQMVELYGSSMLAEELERVTQALIDNRIKHRDDTLEVMMRGMILLPDYLEKLQHGQYDYPMVLLPLLNDLRASRGAPLLSESALFSPKLDVDAPIPVGTAEEPIDLVLRKFRFAYHSALLEWFKGEKGNSGLNKLNLVFEKLRPAASDPDTGRILWAANGLIEALKDQGLEASVAVKILMGQMDREFKKIIDKGEFALSSEPPNDLLKNMLYYVASSQSKGNNVVELKNAFNLSSVMPDADTLERARADLSAPNAALMSTVSSVLLEDLTQVKDTLDMFVRSENRELSTINTLVEKLTQMTDTLGMLGFGEQRATLQDQINVLSEMSEGTREVDDNVLMDVAGSLLGLENILGEPTGKTVDVHDTNYDPSDESLAHRFSEPDHRKLVKRVVDEVKVDLAVIKEGFNDYSRAPKHVDALKEVPQLLERIRGSLSMLSLNRAAGILHTVADYIQQKILDSAVRPEPESLDMLADTISSVEYYLESLTESWGHPTAILTVAEESLAGLGADRAEKDFDTGEAVQIENAVVEAENDGDETLVDLSAPVFEEGELDKQSEVENELSLELHETSDTTVPEIDASVLDSEISMAGLELEGFDDDLSELSTAEEPVEDLANEDKAVEELSIDLSDLSAELAVDSSTLQPDVENSITQEFDLTAELDTETDQTEDGSLELATDLDAAGDEDVTNEAAEPVSPSTPPEPVYNTLADELDDEIVEIFLEEAEEEHGNITRLLPQWQNNPGNEEPLKDMRRSFHTLKGSGRLVGALDVGEFSWAFESLLNRVLDNTIEAGPVVFDLIAEARDMLPGLLVLFRAGEKAGAQVFLLMDKADAVAKGEEVSHDSDAVAALGEPTETLEVSAADIERMTQQADMNQESSLEEEPPVFVQTETDKDNLDESLELDLEDVAEDISIELPVHENENHDLSQDSVATELDIDIEGIDVTNDSNGANDSISLELNATDATEESFEIESDIAISSNEISAEIAAPNIDPVLLGIYRKEIETHLLSLREYIDTWRSGEDKTSNHKLIRTLHTLKGSSRTASVPQVAELCNFLEDHTRYLQDGEMEVDKVLIELLEDTGGFIEETVFYLDQPDADLPDNVDLIKRARLLLEKARFESPTIQMKMPDLTELETRKLDGVDEESVDSTARGIDTNEPSDNQEAGITDTANTSTNVATQPPIYIESELDYDEELLEIFIEEGVEILDDCDNTLHEWASEPDNNEHIKSLQRQLHTLKGGARMAGVGEIGDLSHASESLLTAIVDKKMDVSDDVVKILQSSQDHLVKMIEVVRGGARPEQAENIIKAVDVLLSGGSLDAAALDDAPSSVEDDGIEISAGDTNASTTADESNEEEEQLIDLSDLSTNGTSDNIELSTQADDSIASAGGEANVEETNVVPLNTNITSLNDEAGVDTPAAIVEEPSQTRARGGELIRVRSDLLDNLVNFAGEVSIYRSRMDQHTNAFRYNLTELDDTVTRLRGQLRHFEIETEAQIQYRVEETSTVQADFDPLEMDRFTQMQTLSRGMLESLNDLDSLRSILANLTRESETLLLQQSRVNTELQEGLMRTRMVPISGQIPRLRRIVRQTSEELGKKVELDISGADNELDRTILERVMSPIEHMLRNAISHGLESSEVRQANGKDEVGHIRLSFEREGADIVISVTDDGAGINLEAIRAKAIERELIKADANVSEDDLLDFILESGFSTAEEVTQISGRGVGMDVVNSEIKQLGGLLEIQTMKGQGSSFTINMPMSLSVTRALMINVGEELYAIPLLSVESVERVLRDEIHSMQDSENGIYEWQGHNYQYVHLGAALGVGEMSRLEEGRRAAPILLVRSGEHRAAIHVDNLIGSREVVVKPVGPQLSTLRGIAGATISGEGEVVLVLDLGVLIRLSVTDMSEEAGSDLVAEIVEDRIPLVMVVDDSITVRKVTTRLLERNNFLTVSAKDGVDALAQLQDYKPDVMLLDVEMPRMDGFELATNIRNDDEINKLPIIMITSRTGQKHRDRAMGIGVNIYMGKPYSEGELLENINNLLNAQDD